MTQFTFENGMKKLDANFGNYNSGLKIELWGKFKDFDLTIWQKMIDDLLLQEFKPKIADFYRVYRENKGHSSNMVECRNCGNDYEKPSWQCDSDDWCEKCLKWRDTDEAKAVLSSNKEKIRNALNDFKSSHKMPIDNVDVPF